MVAAKADIDKRLARGALYEEAAKAAAGHIDPSWVKPIEQLSEAATGKSLTHIAFLGLGLPRLMPMIDGTALHYVAWFGPLLVAIVAKPLLDRRFAAWPRSASGLALATT